MFRDSYRRFCISLYLYIHISILIDLFIYVISLSVFLFSFSLKISKLYIVRSSLYDKFNLTMCTQQASLVSTTVTTRMRKRFEHSEWSVLGVGNISITNTPRRDRVVRMISSAHLQALMIANDPSRSAFRRSAWPHALC